MEQGEQHLAAGAVGDHAHGIVEDAIGKVDFVVEHGDCLGAVHQSAYTRIDVHQMNSKTNKSGKSVAALATISLTMAISPAVAAYNGAEVLPGGVEAVVGGGYWAAKTSDPAASRTLHIERIGGGERRMLKQFAGLVHDFKAAPRGDMVAVKEVVRETGVGPDRANVVSSGTANGRQVTFYDYVDSKLVILGTDGSVRGSIPDVHRFAWDPEGGRIAYVNGIEDEEGKLSSTGTWIYDIRTRESTQIHSGGRDVAWADWDGNVYISGALTSGRFGVVRHDPATGITSETRREGIHFSPDGRYYFRQGSEGDPGGEVYLAEGDVPVNLDTSVEEAGRKGRAIVREWFTSRQVIATSAIPGAPVDYLIDVVNGSMQRFDGELLNHKERGDRVWVVRGASISERRLR